jgi:hypothetical protein
MKLRCVLSTPERIAEGKCLGDIPQQRGRRGGITCSPECFKEYRLQKRQDLAEYKCRLCGHRLRPKLSLEPSRSAHRASVEVAVSPKVQQIDQKVG